MIRISGNAKLTGSVAYMPKEHFFINSSIK